MNTYEFRERMRATAAMIRYLKTEHLTGLYEHAFNSGLLRELDNVKDNLSRAEEILKRLAATSHLHVNQKAEGAE